MYWLLGLNTGCQSEIFEYILIRLQSSNLYSIIKQNNKFLTHNFWRVGISIIWQQINALTRFFQIINTGYNSIQSRPVARHFMLCYMLCVELVFWQFYGFYYDQNTRIIKILISSSVNPFDHVTSITWSPMYCAAIYAASKFIQRNCACVCFAISK